MEVILLMALPFAVVFAFVFALDLIVMALYSFKDWLGL